MSLAAGNSEEKKELTKIQPSSLIKKKNLDAFKRPK